VRRCSAEADDLLEVDLLGRCRSGYREATTELDLPLRVYLRRPESGARIHAHPPVAISRVQDGREGLPGDGLPEIVLLRAKRHAFPTPDRKRPHRAMQSSGWVFGTLGADTPGRALSGMTRLTREQVDELERMRGTSSHEQNDPGY